MFGSARWHVAVGVALDGIFTVAPRCACHGSTSKHRLIGPHPLRDGRLFACQKGNPSIAPCHSTTSMWSPKSLCDDSSVRVWLYVDDAVVNACLDILCQRSSRHTAHHLSSAMPCLKTESSMCAARWLMVKKVEAHGALRISIRIVVTFPIVHAANPMHPHQRNIDFVARCRL